MRKITIGGKMFSVACNWRAIEEFAEVNGIKTIQELGKISEMEVKALPAFIHACVREGEKMDGRELVLTEEDIRDNITMSVVAHFMEIFKSQSTFDAPGKSGQLKKKKTRRGLLSRIFGKS